MALNKPPNSGTGLQPLAYQLSEQTISTLVSGTPPHARSRLYLLAANHLYLDLRGRGLPISDKQSIRTVFVQPSSTPSSWLIECSLSRHNRLSPTGQFFWTTENPEEIIERTGEHLDTDLLFAAVSKVIMRLITMSLIFSDTQSTNNSSKKMEKIDIFSTITAKKLTLPDHIKPILRHGSKNPWTLSDVVEVRSYFRDQWFGPNRMTRRLQLINIG